MDNFLVNNRTMSAKDWGIDIGVAIAAFLIGCLQLMLAVSSIVIPDLAMRQYLGIVNVVPSTPVFVALAITTLPLVARRQFSWPVFLFVSVSFLGLQNAFDGLSLSIIGPIIALYTLACERGRTEAIVATVLIVLGLLFADAPSRTASLAFFSRFTNIACMIAAALAGYAYKTHRAYVEATEQRALEAERSREEEAARRVEAERVRIAREVHDITAHSLSAVSIQAAAAERLIDQNPSAAKEAIEAVRTTAKSALDDIRSMIGVLRHGDDAAPTTPAAGTEHLEDIAAYLRQAGVETTLDVSAYDRTRVPAHVDMALFGIAREAATNMVRHAQAHTATIRLTCKHDSACLVVEDDGKGCGQAAAPPPTFANAQTPLPQATLPQAHDGKGHGIAGMAERVHVLGGTFSAGDRPQGGFRVIATIPIPRVEAQ